MKTLIVILTTIFFTLMIPASYAFDVSNQQIVGDNSSEQQILLEFTDNTIQFFASRILVTPNLEFAWIESNSGTFVLDDAEAIVSDKGTIRIFSLDPPAILYAYYLGNDNYKINFYAANNGILEKTMYNAELIGKSVSKTQPIEGDSKIVSQKNLIVDASVTQKSQYYDNFLINISVWDADINPNALMRTSNDGLLSNVPVTITLSKPTGENLVTFEGTTDSFGKFEGKYRWAYRDVLGDYNVKLDVDNGNYVKDFSTFYDGFIQVSETRPTANAGGDDTTANGVLISLDGTASTGSEPLSFAWVQLSGPAGAFVDTTTSTPDYTPAAVGIAVFELTVTDVNGKTNTDSVTITVT